MTGQPLAQDERIAIARLQALLELLPTALDRELAPLGLTSFEYTLLDALTEVDDHRLQLSALARRTNATLPRLSRVVTALEKKQLVVRAPCPTDGRATNALLTQAGLAVHQAARARYADAVRALVFSGLDADGVHQLASLAYAILTKLDPDARGTTAAGAPCPADGPASSAVACAADPPPRNLAN